MLKLRCFCCRWSSAQATTTLGHGPTPSSTPRDWRRRGFPHPSGQPANHGESYCLQWGGGCWLTNERTGCIIRWIVLLLLLECAIISQMHQIGQVDDLCLYKYSSCTWNFPVILPEMQVAGYSWTHMHPNYVALHEVTPWTGVWLYSVHRTCAETAAVSCGTSHAATK